MILYSVPKCDWYLWCKVGKSIFLKFFFRLLSGVQITSEEAAVKVYTCLCMYDVCLQHSITTGDGCTASHRHWVCGGHKHWAQSGWRRYTCLVRKEKRRYVSDQTQQTLKTMTPHPISPMAVIDSWNLLTLIALHLLDRASINLYLYVYLTMFWFRWRSSYTDP